MNTSFEKSSNNTTNEWYTPPGIVEALGHFDLDPCSPVTPPYRIADSTYNKETDGLAHDWSGRVFMNPPYSHPLVDRFVDKMVEHNNGIALLFDRCDQAMWQDKIFPTATALLFMRGRVKFISEDGKQLQGAGCGSVLIAWGEENAEALRSSGIRGKFIHL